MSPIQGSPVTQLRKGWGIETNSPLPAGATYTGQWHDTNDSGDVYLFAVCLSNLGSGSLNVQLTNDLNNAGLIVNGDPSPLAVNANTLIYYVTYLRHRYWRFTFINGSGSAQTSFEIAYCTFQTWLGSFNTGIGATSSVGELVVQPVTGATVPAPDNGNPSLQGLTQFNPTNGNQGLVGIIPYIFGGAFSGTNNAALSFFSKPRTPTVFKRASVTVAGSTALWTPGNGNKFRLLKYLIQVTATSALAVAGDLTISLLDSATDIGMDLIVSVPAAGLTTGDDFISPWIDLGSLGILSVAANNVLNVNLSSALTAGHVNVIACGTEE